jgi:uncharacterized protein YkwD
VLKDRGGGVEKSAVERIRASLGLAVVVGVLASAPFAAATGTTVHRGERRQVMALPSLNATIVARVNAIRTVRGLRRVTVAPGLAAAAGLHSRQMARTGRFEHESPDGTPFWQRVERFYGKAGFRGWSVGETLVWESPATTAAEVVSTWLDSPPHREILLDPQWHEIGVAAVQDTAAPGDFEGLQATIVTADFGVRGR